MSIVVKKKRHKQSNEIFGEVQSFIKNIYGRLTKTPNLLHEFMSENYKTKKRKHKR